MLKKTPNEQTSFNILNQVSIYRLIHLDDLFFKNSKTIGRIFTERHVKKSGSSLIDLMVL